MGKGRAILGRLIAAGVLLLAAAACAACEATTFGGDCPVTYEVYVSQIPSDFPLCGEGRTPFIPDDGMPAMPVTQMCQTVCGPLPVGDSLESWECCVSPWKPDLVECSDGDCFL